MSEWMLILLVKASNILHNVYTKSFWKVSWLQQKLKLLLLTTMENYNLLLITFEIFCKKTCQQQKLSAKPKRQATLTDMLSKASSFKFANCNVRYFL